MLRHWLSIAAAGLVVAVAAHAESDFPPVTVFVPKVCLACIEWAEHLRQNGFTVTLDDTRDMAEVKRQHRVPPALEARHTALVGKYFVEGHVPADDIKTLLRERPAARGLAVPGGPRGAPGLDVMTGTGCERGCAILADDGPAEATVNRRELYETLLVREDGSTSTYARH